jgi:hypothetical protein
MYRKLKKKKKNATRIPKLAYEYIQIGRRKVGPRGKYGETNTHEPGKKNIEWRIPCRCLRKLLFYRTSKGCTVRGSNPSGGGDFPHLSRPAMGPIQPPIQCYRVSFPGVKRPGRGVDHPPPSSAEIKERVELYLYSPMGFRGLLQGEL